MTEGKKIIKVACPVCRKETQWDANPFRPFCSERCRLIDLGKWASEEYRIPAPEREDPSGDGDEEKK